MPFCREIAERCATNAKSGWSLSFIWFVSFVWLNQIDQIDQMNLPQSRPSRMSHARTIAAQSFTMIQKIAAMASNRSRTVPAMMQAT